MSHASRGEAAYIDVMNRRDILIGLAAASIAPTARAQDAAGLGEVSKYLNQLRTVQGRFTQINANGSQTVGTYFWQRPGRIRFEYGASGAMVIADGINVAIFDPKSNSGVQRYPLRLTPLRFLLQDRIDLRQRNLATGTASQNGLTYVTLQDPKKPRDGSMVLTLRNKPPTLRGWTVREKNGQETTIRLDSLDKVRQLTPRLFNIEFTELEFRRNL